MKASDPIVMLVSFIATRTVANATLRMRKMSHPSCAAAANVLTFLLLTNGTLNGAEGSH
jgi:hypothetical protein